MILYSYRSDKETTIITHTKNTPGENAVQGDGGPIANQVRMKAMRCSAFNSADMGGRLLRSGPEICSLIVMGEKMVERREGCALK